MTDHPLTENYHIVLLRHGESVGNAEGYYQGQADFPLTERGRQQTELLARRWVAERVVFDSILSSPLKRARETVEILTEMLNLPVQYDPIWMERNNGILAGLPHDEASMRYPEAAFVHPYQPIGETGESQWELYLRGGRAVQSLLKRPQGHYLIVSHGGILNMVMYAILGIVPQANFHGPRFRFGNTAFATLTYYPHDHKWFVMGINDQFHLKEMLIE
jgi:2,3-bisphosphoglycerate-dependent phosphoglycerate mutase